MKQLKEYKESGSNLYVAKRLSLAYTLFSVANSYAEEANERLGQYGLECGKLKTKINNLVQSFDTYDKTMRAMLNHNSPDTETKAEIVNEVCDRYSLITEFCEQYLNDTPKPPQ